MGPVMDKRYIIDSVLIILAMIFILSSLLITLAFSIIPNQRWDSVLKCESSFPSVPPDTFFSDKTLLCPSSQSKVKVFYEKLVRRSGHEVFSIALQAIVLCSGIAAYLPTLIYKRYRKTSYFMNMELVYGALGLFSIPSLLALSFTIAEYYGKFSQVLLTQEDSTTFDLNNFKICKAEGPTNSTIDLCDTTWRTLIAKCLLHDDSSHWFGSERDPEQYLHTTYAALDKKEFIHNSVIYDYPMLQNLGFCPFSVTHSVARVLLLLSTIILFVIPINSLFYKQPRRTASSERLGHSEENSKENLRGSLDSSKTNESHISTDSSESETNEKRSMSSMDSSIYPQKMSITSTVSDHPSIASKYTINNKKDIKIKGDFRKKLMDDFSSFSITPSTKLSTVSSVSSTKSSIQRSKSTKKNSHNGTDHPFSKSPANKSIKKKDGIGIHDRKSKLH